AGDAQRVRNGAGVVHVGRRPSTIVEQVDQQRTRRTVVAAHLVEEGVAIPTAVVVDLAQAGVDPDVAGANVVADRLCRGGGGRQSEAEAERQRQCVEAVVPGHVVRSLSGGSTVWVRAMNWR